MEANGDLIVAPIRMTPLVARLQDLAHNVDTVRTEEMAGRADPEIWRAAQNAEHAAIDQAGISKNRNRSSLCLANLLANQLAL